MYLLDVLCRQINFISRELSHDKFPFRFSCQGGTGVGTIASGFGLCVLHSSLSTFMEILLRDTIDLSQTALFSGSVQLKLLYECSSSFDMYLSYVLVVQNTLIFWSALYATSVPGVSKNKTTLSRYPE